MKSKPIIIILLSLILVFCSFLGGVYIVIKEEARSKAEPVIATEKADDPQLNNVYSFVSDVSRAIEHHDINYLKENMIGNDFEISKDNFKELCNYFTDKNIELNKFTVVLKKQARQYLDSKPVTNTFFYLDDHNGKIVIKVNKGNIQLLPRTRASTITISLDGDSKEYDVTKGSIFTEGEFPVTTKVNAKVGEWEEEFTFDYIDGFLDEGGMKGYDCTLRRILFKRGAGICVNTTTNSPGATLYINGEKTDIKLDEFGTLVDVLKEGDTLRAENDGERSKEVKIRKNSKEAYLEFKIKIEERFGVPKDIVDSAEVITKNFLNVLSNAVSAKDPNVISNVVDERIQHQASSIAAGLINQYNSLIFSNVNVTNASQSGSRVDLQISYSYESMGLLDSSVVQNGYANVSVDTSNAKVVTFNLN